MKRIGNLREWVISASFVLLGACLLLARARLPADEGFRTQRVEGGTLYRPEGMPVFVSVDGESTVLGEVPAGGELPAALVLPGAGARAVSAELARRGVMVLASDGSVSAREAWDRLLGEHGVCRSSAALLSGEDTAAEALTLAKEFADEGSPCAAVIVLTDSIDAAVGHPGRNLLLLTDTEPTDAEKLAFYGDTAAAERGFTGYFGEGSARAVTRVSHLSFADARVHELVMDWKGSTLGHAVEIPDSDRIYPLLQLWRAAAFVCFFAAAAVWLPKIISNTKAGRTGKNSSSVV